MSKERRKSMFSSSYKDLRKRSAIVRQVSKAKKSRTGSKVNRFRLRTKKSFQVCELGGCVQTATDWPSQTYTLTPNSPSPRTWLTNHPHLPNKVPILCRQSVGTHRLKCEHIPHKHSSPQMRHTCALQLDRICPPSITPPQA